MLPYCRTFDRPYTSESGPRNSGPKAYARTNIDVSMATTVEFVTPNSLAITAAAGAIMDEDTGDMKTTDPLAAGIVVFRG